MQKVRKMLKISQISPGPEFSLFIKGIKRKKLYSSRNVIMMHG